jgi:replication fork protection complex subunit Csm3/Swi3
MHDVFPKARFRDCIAMTEKVGHTTQVKVMRRQWIDESKPKKRMDEDDDLDLDGIEVLESIEREQAREEGGGEAGQGEVEGTKEKDGEEDEPLFVDDDMSDFDVDELLGTQKPTETTAVGETTSEVGDDAKSIEQDEFEDEMDAMKDIGDFF